MTRENKLALVVGFGLILFVGILISDHFSVVRTQQAANLTSPGVLDPLIATANIEPASFVDLLDPPLQPVTTSGNKLQEVPTAANGAAAQDSPNGGWPVVPTESAGPATQVVQNPTTGTAADDLLNNPPAGFERVPNPETDAEFVFYDVESGDTFYSICMAHYGNPSRVQSLAVYNNIDDPGSLRVGQRLRLPKDAARGAGVTEPSSKPTVKTKTAPVKVTYTVRGGDTLAKIAQRFMGSKAKWQKLYEMNKDVIDDPDNVKVGTVLRVS
jgi:nucleoid-associated protein YgaU